MNAQQEDGCVRGFAGEAIKAHEIGREEEDEHAQGADAGHGEQQQLARIGLGRFGVAGAHALTYHRDHSKTDGAAGITCRELKLLATALAAMAVVPKVAIKLDTSTLPIWNMPFSKPLGTPMPRMDLMMGQSKRTWNSPVQIDLQVVVVEQHGHEHGAEHARDEGGQGGARNAHVSSRR